MQNQNETNAVETTPNLFNNRIIEQNLIYIENVATNTQTRNNLVSEIFFDYLTHKADYKKEMILKGYVENTIKNKEIAEFYVKSQVKEIASKLFLKYGVELKDNNNSYTITNTLKTQTADNIIKGVKEYLRNTNTLLLFISTNNLKIRVKLLDFRILKTILNNLNLLNAENETLKTTINSIENNLTDNEYIVKLKSVIKAVQQHNKKETQTAFDVSQLKTVADVETLIKQLQEKRNELLNIAVADVETATETVQEKETITELFEIQE